MRRFGLLAGALASTACGGEDDARCANVELEGAVLVLEQDQDRKAAGLGRLDERGCFEDKTDPALGQDPALSDAHGRPFVVVRDQGGVREVATDHLGISSPVFASDGDDRPNPHDVDVDPETGAVWITRYDAASIARVSKGELGSVDLGAHADPEDGLPEMEAVRIEGRTVAVSLQRLDRTDPDAIWPPTGPGLVALLDADPPHGEIGTIELVGRNPFGRFVPMPSGELAIAMPGEHGAVDALDGIDAVDLQARTVRQLASETFLGGTVLEVAFGVEGEVYAILEGPNPENATWVVAFDPRSADQPRKLVDSRDSKPAFVHSGLAVSGCCVIVGDRTRERPTIWFFNRQTGEEEARLTIPEVELPPLALLAIPP